MTTFKLICFLIGTLVSITYRNQLIIKNQLLENTTDITEAEKKAKRFFQSCLDPTSRIEKLGSKPLMDILKTFMYKNNQSELAFNKTFTEILLSIQIKFGLNAFFDFEILDDEKNSTYNNIEVSANLTFNKNWW